MFVIIISTETANLKSRFWGTLTIKPPLKAAGKGKMALYVKTTDPFRVPTMTNEYVHLTTLSILGSRTDIQFKATK